MAHLRPSRSDTRLAGMMTKKLITDMPANTKPEGMPQRWLWLRQFSEYMSRAGMHSQGGSALTTPQFQTRTCQQVVCSRTMLCKPFCIKALELSPTVDVFMPSCDTASSGSSTERLP